MFGGDNPNAAVLIAVIVALYFVVSLSVLLIWFSTAKQKQKKELLANRFAIRSARVTNKKSHSKSISDALDDLKVYRNKKMARPLARLLLSAGVEIGDRAFLTIWIAVAVIVELVLLFIGFKAIIHFFALITIGLLPYLVLKRRANWFRQRFAQDFASAVDVIVRGVRNGLSVNACFKVVAQEGPDAVRDQFQKLFNDLDLGVPLIAAMDRFSERSDLPEAKFFSIVISVQSTTGGNLSTALENLSKLLRERKQLKGKIKALSSEAKTSSWIIGALPVLVLVMIQLFSPQYSSVLFTTITGQLILAGSAVWMVIGILVMARMIDLEV